MKIDTSQIQHLKAICLLNKKSIFKPSYWLVAIISILVDEHYLDKYIYKRIDQAHIQFIQFTNDEKGRFMHH